MIALSLLMLLISGPLCLMGALPTGPGSESFLAIGIILFLLGGLFYTWGHRAKRQRMEERRHKETLATIQAGAQVQAGNIQAQLQTQSQQQKQTQTDTNAALYAKARRLWRSGQKGEARGILQALAAQGYGPAQTALEKMPRQ